MTGPATGDALAARAAAWRAADPDPRTQAELDQLIADGDTAALAERFQGSLAFGTAGIRAAMGAGPARMNRLVVGRVAAGLARYITGTGTGTDRATNTDTGAGAAADGVVVGYDGRANSAVFAADAARIMARAGIAVSMLPRALPTPVLAFAVRHQRAAYGLMVTASHNPGEDNGIKVYVRDGGQLLPPADTEIAAFIDAVDPLRLPAGWAEGPFESTPADDAVGAYVTAVAAGERRPPAAPGLKVVHTALHGVGDATLRAVLAAAGWPAPTSVAAQRRPDPAFATVPYPNPEAPGVLDLVREAAEREGADLALANDPDADRLAVMVPGPGGWQPLTGDELGALLGDAVLGDAALARPVPGGTSSGGTGPVVATTVVSGSLLRRLAQSAGVRCVTTLTGFKWIVRAGGDDGTLIYGYEQALGYAVRPDLVADKDGISAALLVLGLAADLARQGRTLADRLDDLALAHGLHVTRERTVRGEGAIGLARLAQSVERVRREPPRLLAGRPVMVTDLLAGSTGLGGAGLGGAGGGDGGVVDLAGGHAERSPGQPVPPADVLIWHLGGDARVMIRPSGTEPVLKLYAEVVRPVASGQELAVARTTAARQAASMLAAAAVLLEPGAVDLAPPSPGAPSPA
jgi:phosphomannomutase